jgi:hypothetical protein
MRRMLPFSRDAFFALFEQYNAAIWPAQIAAYALAVLALVCVLRPFRGSDRAVAALLALTWLWDGIAYHLLHFAPINFWAYGFAALFVIQGLLFAAAAVRGHPAWRFRADRYGWTGLGLSLFAMVGYPLLGWLLGHGWPRAPVFGVAPCPMTIFSWGLLLLAEPRVPIHLAIVPALWTIIGASAAFFLGVPEDLTLLLAGAVTLAMIVAKNRAARAAPALR